MIEFCFKYFVHISMLIIIIIMLFIAQYSSHTTSYIHKIRYVHILSRISVASKIVTGFWKTDQIVTLGLFHFIGPANGYTCTLHIHGAITRLG